MKKKYLKILKLEKNIFNIAINEHEYLDEFQRISNYVIAPVIFMYASWVIQQAEKKNIKVIYFFSRDSYLIHHIAQKICKKRKNGIKCSYFFCSRFSLRMAAYWFHDDCAYEKLFNYSCKMSPSLLLQRANFSHVERKRVYADIGYSDNEDVEFAKREFNDFCKKVRESDVFEQILYEKSYAAYKTICQYMKQEMFTKFDDIAVVDVGWNGSMQYTLKKLLDSMGVKTDLHGYYIGLFAEPPRCIGNNYSHWVFGPGDNFTKSWFSHNLLECLCSAPHGMTIGYKYSENRIVACLADNENSNIFVNNIFNELNNYEVVCGADYSETYKLMAKKLLYNIMVNPDQEELSALKSCNFCDDVAEQYHDKIVLEVEKARLKKEIVPYRLFHHDNTDELYWYYGSVVASGYRAGFMYKLGYTATRLLIHICKYRRGNE